MEELDFKESAWDVSVFESLDDEPEVLDHTIEIKGFQEEKEEHEYDTQSIKVIKTDSEDKSLEVIEEPKIEIIEEKEEPLPIAEEVKSNVQIINEQKEVEYKNNIVEYDIGSTLTLRKDKFPEGIGGTSTKARFVFTANELKLVDCTCSIPDQKLMNTLDMSGVTLSLKKSSGTAMSVSLAGKLRLPSSFPEGLAGMELTISELTMKTDGTFDVVNVGVSNINAKLYIIKDEVVDYNVVETHDGYKCLIEDISEAGALVRIGGKGVQNVQIKLQFPIQSMLIIMFGVVRTVEFNEAENQSLLHFECVHIDTAMKNEVLKYVYDMLPQNEKEVYDALTLTDADEKAEDGEVPQELEKVDSVAPAEASVPVDVTNPLQSDFSNSEDSEKPVENPEDIQDDTIDIF